jgi:hypothetical protein
MYSVGTGGSSALSPTSTDQRIPFPDGDTGTNMLLTMRSAVEEAGTAENEEVGAIARAMAYGALMGARGNSGVSSLNSGEARPCARRQRDSGRSRPGRRLTKASSTA